MNTRLKVFIRVVLLILLGLLLLASSFGQSTPPPGLAQSKSMTVCTGITKDSVELGYATTYEVDDNVDWMVFDAMFIKEGNREMNDYFWLLLRVNNRTSTLEIAIVSDNVWDWDLPSKEDLDQYYDANSESFLEFQSAASEFGSRTVHGIEQAPFRTIARTGAELALNKYDLIDD